MVQSERGTTRHVQLVTGMTIASRGSSLRGMGRAKGLKAALQSQQNRLKAKEKLSHAKQRAEHKARRRGKPVVQSSHNVLADRSGNKTTGPSRNLTIPFKNSDRILLIGEGNFSFAHALIDHPPRELGSLPPHNITATAYDTEEECCSKYPECPAIITSLRDRGVEVIFGVDATRLEGHHALKGRNWDRIVWNFPHAGKGISDQDRNILSNQILILGFLRSAAKMLQRGSIPSVTAAKKKNQEGDSDDECDDISLDSEFGEPCPPSTRGTVLITLRNVVPYTHWDIPRLAKNPPAPHGSTPAHPEYVLLRSFRFYRSMWKGYEHRMTKGERAHGTGTTGEGGEDRTWEFCLRRE